MLLDDHGGKLQSIEILIIAIGRFHQRFMRVNPRLDLLDHVLVINEAADLVFVLNQKCDDRELLRKNSLSRHRGVVGGGSFQERPRIGPELELCRSLMKKHFEPGDRTTACCLSIFQ